MSFSNQNLNFLKSKAKFLEEIEDEPSLEDIEDSQPSQPIIKPSGIEKLKAQARENAAKESQIRDSTLALLENFKKFLDKENRSKLVELCEKEDKAKLNYITVLGFNRVLKILGFRLYYEELKALITALNVYNPSKDLVFYNKIISSSFRKLYKRDPYTAPLKMTQLQAIKTLQKFIRDKKQYLADKIKQKKETITPKDIINGLAQKIHESGRPLLRTFEDIDKDHSGFIDINELEILFQFYGVNLSHEHLEAVFRIIDIDGMGKITYKSLLKIVEACVPSEKDVLTTISVTVDEKEKMVEDMISGIKGMFKDSKMTPENVFRMFDKENKGVIDADTFITNISKITNGYSQFQIRQLFQYLDTSQDGIVTIVEFGKVFFDIKETPIQMLKRIEMEEKKRFEEEIRKKWEQEDSKRRPKVPNEAQEKVKSNEKPTIQEEIQRKKQEIEEAQKREEYKKLNPIGSAREEKWRKEQQAAEEKKKLDEEKAKKLEEEKKKLEEAKNEAKKKRELDEKNVKGIFNKVIQNLGKSKTEEKKTPARSTSVKSSARSQGRRKVPTRGKAEDRGKRSLQASSDSIYMSRVYPKELIEMIKKDYVYPVVQTIPEIGDLIISAKKNQTQHESRPVTKHVYIWDSDWKQEILNPMPRTVWVSGAIGRVGYIDDEGYLNQLDLLTGNQFPVLHLGTKPPYKKTPLLAGVCDSDIGRLYLLNQQWVIEVWELHQKTTAPKKRIKVLSKTINKDYIEKSYRNRQRNAFPKIIVITETGKILVNATCVDGFIYCFEPISLTLVWRVRLTVRELQVPKQVVKAFEIFSGFLRDCAKIGIYENRVFELLDRNGDFRLSFEEFCKAVKENKLPLTEGQIRAMFKAMDIDGSGMISLDEFQKGIINVSYEPASDSYRESAQGPSDNLTNFPPQRVFDTKLAKLDSSGFQKNSIKYVIHKTLEQGVDFYKICKDNDPNNTGTLPKDVMSTILLCLPVGLTPRDLKKITEEDFAYSSNGQVDYQEIFERESYIDLLKQAQKPGLNFLEPETQERGAIVEDFEYLENLSLVAFSTNNPLTSIIYLKHISGHLISKLVGHFGDMPPILYYISSSNVLLSGERRENISYIGPFANLPPCELILWNLQKDLINKFSLNPPWTMKPYKKVYAHDCSFIDINYLPVTQIIVTTALDGCIKLWNPTGVPYSLTSPLNADILKDKPKLFPQFKLQYTKSNELLACVGVLENQDMNCFRLISSAYDNCEWLVAMFLPSSASSICGSLQTFGFKRLSISVQAKQHDCDIPSRLSSELYRVYQKHRDKQLAEYRAGLSVRLEKIVSNVKISRTFEKEIKISLVRSIIFECNFDNVFKIMVVLPDRFKKGKVCSEEFYNILVTYAGFWSTPYCDFLKTLENISENLLKEVPEPVKKPHIGLITLLEMIENKKNPPAAPGATKKTPGSLITSIKSEKQMHEAMFETPIKDLEQELFEYLALRLMERKVPIGKLFEEIDSDQDGLVSSDEFSIFLIKLGYNLRKNEVKNIMKCVDYNCDNTITYKELMIKLKAFGYKEEWQPEFFTHEWEDESLQNFFKSFSEKSQFHSITEHFQYYDYNKDGILSPSELLLSLTSIDKTQSERLMNIILVTSQNNMSIESLAKALNSIEKELPKTGKQEWSYKVMEKCLENYNVVAQLRKSVEDLGLYALSTGQKARRGLELFSKQYRLEEGLSFLASGLIRFTEIVDYLLAHALEKCYVEIFKGIIAEELNVQISPLPLEPIQVKKMDPADFKVSWESEKVISSILNIYSGSLLPGLEDVVVYVYSPEGLKHISQSKLSLYDHLTKEMSIHRALQERCKGLVQISGIHEKYLGMDKTIFAFYSNPPGISLQSFLDNNGGLLKIPLLCNTKVSLYLFKLWGKKILNIIQSLHTYSVSPRLLFPENLTLCNKASEVFLNTFRGVGLLDHSGNIISAPDLDLYIKGQVYKNPFVAPEFYLENSQNTAVDVWNFGALMFNLLFGHPPECYVEVYERWAGKKFVESRVLDGVKGAFSFPYNAYEKYEVVCGRACEWNKSGMGVIKSLKNGSFGGIVREDGGKMEIDEIEEVFNDLKAGKNTKVPEMGDMGRVLDMIFLCLQIDPTKRPTIKSLLNSPVFDLSKTEEKQALSFASLIFSHKNPEIIITQHITTHLNLMKSQFSLDQAEECINLIESLGNALFSYEDSIGQSTSQAISSTNLPAKEKEAILKKNLSSPITELSNQCIKDGVFDTLCYLSLNFYHQNEISVYLSYANLIKYLLFHLNSEDSGLSNLVSVLIEVLLKMFVGEDTSLPSKDPISGYVLKESFWTPELYEIIGPVYRQSISESGLGHHTCPVIKEFLKKTRHSDYFSELIMISENFCAIKSLKTTTTAKRNALKHIKSMLKTKNEHKIRAALDFKLPQVILMCLQDQDLKVRAEAVEIFYIITEGCVEPLLPKLPGATKAYKALGIIDFMATGEKVSDKIIEANDGSSGALKELAICFESPIFVFPIVRLLKIKSEAYDTKEIAARVLISVLGGSEKCQLACLSPITDAISALCKCLVVSSKTADSKSGKILAPIMKGLLSKLLYGSRAYILACFKNTPGAEALLKEQGLFIPEKVTLKELERAIDEPLTLEKNVQNIVQGLKNWLVHERLPSSGDVEKDIVLRCFKYLQECLEYYWDYADIQPTNDRIIEKTSSQITTAKDKVKLILLFYEWALFSDQDYDWFKLESNVNWLITLTNHSLKSAGSECEVFQLEEESILIQRILCRMIVKKKADLLLSKVTFGKAFANQLMMQYERLGKVITKYSDPLYVLKHYPENSQIRLATLMNLLQFSNLQRQFLDTDFIDVLVKKYLNDYNVLSVKYNKIPNEYLSFRETPPIRSEAINIIMTILKEKSKCKFAYDDLLLHLQRYKTIQYEILNMQSSNPVIQATALELLQAFISSKDPQLDFLLTQGNAPNVFWDIFSRNIDLSMRFPVIANYCKR